MAKVWTETKIEKLKTYLECGLTYQEISAKFKTTVKAIEKVVYNNSLSKFRQARPKKEAKVVIDPTVDVLQQLDDKYYQDLKDKTKTKWNIKKSKAKKSDKPFQSYLVIGDVHVPEHNMVAVKSILHLMDDVKFDGFINLGDFMDLGCISHWNKSKRLTSEGMKLKEDYIIGNAILDEFDKRLPKNCDKHYLFGNHEDWYNQFIEYNPMLEGMLDPYNELHLEDRGYNVIKVYNNSLKIGQLTFKHGQYTGMHYVKKHLDMSHTNVMFGHLHSARMRFESSDCKELSLAGYCLGCLCDMAPSYMKNMPNKWTHGFAVVHFFENGDFDVDLKRIVHGKFVYNGKVYNGNVS